MVPTKLHLLAEERRPRGVPASRLEGVVVRKGKGKGKGGHAESLPAQIYGASFPADALWA